MCKVCDSQEGNNHDEDRVFGFESPTDAAVPMKNERIIMITYYEFSVTGLTTFAEEI